MKQTGYFMTCEYFRYLFLRSFPVIIFLVSTFMWVILTTKPFPPSFSLSLSCQSCSTIFSHVLASFYVTNFLTSCSHLYLTLALRCSFVFIFITSFGFCQFFKRPCYRILFINSPGRNVRDPFLNNVEL